MKKDKFPSPQCFVMTTWIDKVENSHILIFKLLHSILKIGSNKHCDNQPNQIKFIYTVGQKKYLVSHQLC
jgi:hypothetical protein